MFLTIAYVTLAVLVLFGLCILIHELGHFIAARAFGMVVETFSIGFGPAIWKKKIGGITYKIGVFPIGGYVALPQMDPSGPAAQAADASGKKDEPASPVPRVSPWKKIVVAVAGAAGNMLLAYIIAWIVFVAGKPSAPAERSAAVGFVETNSEAYAQGVRIGDEIIFINGRAVGNWQDVIQENARFEEVEMLVKSAGLTNAVALRTEKNQLGFRVVPGLHNITLCKVLSVEAGSSAAGAGIQSGDLVRTVEGVEVLSIDHLIALISGQPEQPLDVAVERSGAILSMQVTPRFDPDLQRARIGIRFDPYAVDTDRVVHIAPGAQIKSHSLVIIRVLHSLVTPKEAKATSQALGGPLMIIYMLQDMVRKGIIIALWFTCLLNVNLAILNLLPLPVLDGGHVVFALFEIITRRPVPAKFVLILDQVFFGLLILAIVLITGRDLKRLNQLRLLSKPPAARESPTNAVPPPAGVLTNENPSQE
ncbi:MAG: RIP metalloprotease RseP [Kiritimatiellia bacterium]